MNDPLIVAAASAAQNFHLRRFGAEDMLRYDSLVADLQHIFSGDQTLKFVPRRRLDSREKAETYLQMTILKCTSKSDLVFFLTDKSTGQVVGVVEIVSPETAKLHYHLSEYPHFIEFYLSEHLQARGLMSGLLPGIVVYLKKNGISRIAAVADRQNHKACQVLTKTFFKNHGLFDLKQDFYLYE